MPVINRALLFVIIMPLLSVAFAATPTDAELLEEIQPPPKVIEGEPMEEPAVTIIKKGEDEVEEYRIHGELYMIKVTPKNGKPYYMHRQEANGEWINDGPNKPLSVPHWILFKF